MGLSEESRSLIVWSALAERKTPAMSLRPAREGSNLLGEGVLQEDSHRWKRRIQRRGI